MNKRYKLLCQQSAFPVFQNRMYELKKEAIDCQKGDIHLVQNLDTGLIYNLDFNSKLMKYDKHYQNEQAVSHVFQKHLDNVAKIIERLLGKCELVEVGCGKAYFLELLQSKGFGIVGFDPTYEGQNPSVERRYFNKDVGVQAEGIVLRHVLEHIQDPIGFLQRLNIANTRKGNIYIEVPCFDWIVKNKTWFDIFYEHVNYFRLSDLNRMFGNVIESGKLFGGQYIYVVAELASIKQPVFDINNQLSKVEIEFSIDKSFQPGPLVICGGASKGVIYSLLMIRAGNTVDMVIDINPAKQGKYLPATGLLVHSPEDAMDMLPKGATVLVMNPNYMREIKEMTENRYVYIGVDCG